MKRIDKYLDLMNRGVILEVDTPHEWVRITTEEHLIKAIENNCIIRALPSKDVSATELALILSK